MICSSEKRFFTSNLLALGNWTPVRRATQNRGDVGGYRGGALSRLQNGARVASQRTSVRI
ncbi:hypothetical protein CSC64_00945 [Pseudoxanthomonas koreensis]|nr:hypothetical protein CSC64_00945 [Pseudoxanthomonas koreensis]